MGLSSDVAEGTKDSLRPMLHCVLVYAQEERASALRMAQHAWLKKVGMTPRGRAVPEARHSSQRWY